MARYVHQQLPIHFDSLSKGCPSTVRYRSTPNWSTKTGMAHGIAAKSFRIAAPEGPLNELEKEMFQLITSG
jgi:hypothetical protein